MIDKKYDLNTNEFIKPTNSLYSIPIYENGVKTEWTIDGVIGDEKYFELIKLGNGKDLPDIIRLPKVPPIIQPQKNNSDFLDFSEYNL